MIKRCTKCCAEKDSDEFAVQKRHKSGRQSWCKSCHGKLRNNDPEYRRQSVLKTRHRMSVEEYNWLATLQNGVCAICFETNIDRRRLAVDHDHLCCPHRRSCKNCTRGLLCDRCNRYALPQIEKHKHLQNDFIREYLRRRPLLQIAAMQSLSPPLDQIPIHRFEKVEQSGTPYN